MDVLYTINQSIFEVSRNLHFCLFVISILFLFFTLIIVFSVDTNQKVMRIGNGKEEPYGEVKLSYKKEGEAFEIYYVDILKIKLTFSCLCILLCVIFLLPRLVKDDDPINITTKIIQVVQQGQTIVDESGRIFTCSKHLMPSSSYVEATFEYENIGRHSGGKYAAKPVINVTTKIGSDATQKKWYGNQNVTTYRQAEITCKL